ncbi:MAG: FecR family protein [Granulosicoccaceae bacterium]
MKNMAINGLLHALAPLLLATTMGAVSIVAATSVAAAGEASTTEIRITQRDYSVKDGDTFKSIAQTELGKIGLAPHLAEYNGRTVDTVLKVAEVIQIPLYGEMVKEFATIVFLKGEVKRGGESIERDAEVYINETLTTGDDGFVSMLFKSGSVINLQPNTNVKLVKLNCLDDDESCVIEIEADQGELTSDVKNSVKQPADFRITTPYASAAVRGTMFDVAVDKSGLGVGVTEGGVGLAASGKAVELDTGFGSVSKKGQGLGEPIALLPPPVYRYVPTRAAKGDRILWWNLSDADNYIATLTTDKEGRAVFTSGGGEKTDFVVDDESAGGYYLNVRGVDSNGLKGFKSSTKITVAQIDDQLEPVETEISYDGNEFLVSVIDPADDAPGYEIQVSPDPNFDDPLSVDINRRSAAVFRLEADKLYARARVLINPKTVSAFGAIAESP